MSVLAALHFGGGARTPQILQTEAAECGLACIAMIAGFHGHAVDLATLRSRHPISAKGAGLAQLMEVAVQPQRAARPARLEVAALARLNCPAILHWDMNHFVVLVDLRKSGAVIHDSARGRCRLTHAELSRHFTGVAVEITPTHEFAPRVERRRISLRALLGRPRGVRRAITEVLMLALIQVAVTALRGWVLMVFSTQPHLQLVSNLFSHLMRLPMVYFEKRHLGDVVSRIESLKAIQRTLTGSFFESVVDWLMVIATLVMLYIYSPLLALVVCGAAVLYGAVRALWYRTLREAEEEQILRTAKQQSHFLESVRGVQSLKPFNRAGERRAVFQNLAADHLYAGIRVQRLHIVFKAVNGVLFGAENVAVIGLGAALVLQGGFSVGMLFAFVAYKHQFTSRIIGLIEKGIELKMLGLHSERVADIALTGPEDERAGAALSSPRGYDIELKNVGFRYADAEPCILNDINLRITAGEAVAIVGPSGCGKTTLLKIMLGLLPVSGGEVRVGGTTVAQLGVEAYRALIGTVLHEDHLFAGSIADNIAFFDPAPQLERVRECARLAAVESDILAMPMGYHTLIGDMGAALSGGQRQRLLLARALYKRPRILFLDEATSHLAVAREREVNAAVAALRLTRIIVAHRPETIASCDRVFELGAAAVQDHAQHARATAHSQLRRQALVV